MAPPKEHRGRKRSAAKSRSASTVADIVRLTGLSRAAVYRSLRNDPRMSLDTKQHVHTVANQLNYRPMAGARAIASGRTNTIGVVFSGLDMQRSSEWFGHYAVALEKISEVLDERDYSMSLLTWSDQREELRMPRLLREVGVDGMIMLNTPETPVLERILHRYGKPYVAMDAVAIPGRIAVAVDEMRAAELMVEHLIQLGHRRIAYVPLPVQTRVPAGYIPLREDAFPRGYVRAMSAAGLAPIPGWDESQKVESFLQSAWSLPNPPTALLTYDDFLGLEVMRQLHHRGLSVPRDVSVGALQYHGFADKGSTHMSLLPDITCKADLQDQMAGVVVEKLLELIEFPHRSVESILLPPRLDLRGSTGVCPAAQS